MNFKLFRPNLLLFPTLLTLFLFAFASEVSAHILKSDGPIGAVLHIDPDDNPIIGKQATFFLEFSDKDGKFSLADCNCKFHILKNNEELFSTFLVPFEEGSNTASGFSYTFKEKGVYQIQVEGEPVNSSTFSSFSLSYDWRIERENGGSGGNTSFIEQNLHFLLLGAILLVFLAIVLSKRIRKNNSNSQISAKILLLFGILTALLATHSLELDHLLMSNFHHQDSSHPCCVSQPKDEVQTVTIVEESSRFGESLKTEGFDFVSVVTFNDSTRSPPNQ